MIAQPISHIGTLAALVIACAGAAIFAQPAVAQTAKSLNCNGCVKSKQIKNKGIRTRDIGNNAVTGAKVRNNSLTGSDIQNGSIGPDDLAPELTLGLGGVSVAASQGAAAPGNDEPANFLVVLADKTGAPVTHFDQGNFTVINQFSLPGQLCGFSNNIVGFNNVGTGAYQIQVGLGDVGFFCPWVAGDYLAQIIVNGETAPGSTPAVTLRGQAAATLSVF